MHGGPQRPAAGLGHERGPRPDARGSPHSPCPRRFAELTFLDLGKALAGGALDWHRALDDAGAQEAHAVLFLASDSPCDDVLMVDRRAVLFTSVLEEQQKAWGKDVYLGVELHNPFSVWCEGCVVGRVVVLVVVVG